ncbi:MAG: Segregation and condensation protein B [Parcubacteria group bacterium GW2011_GWC1_43_30]|nr:MAG: Segregation and condensation protein B [Parcubacteria group bacterium GW2011_GWC1_43_30]
MNQSTPPFMFSLELKIEAILFFKNEPVSISELAKLTGEKSEAVKASLFKLREFYKDRGIVVIFNGEFVSFGTHPDVSELIENLVKEEFSRELSRASLETLAIILYKGPISRREIDHIRGVNSGFILRSLMIRGLIERTEGTERSYSYKATLKLLEHLGITRREDLPEYQMAFKKIKEFMETIPTEQDG